MHKTEKTPLRIPRIKAITKKPAPAGDIKAKKIPKIPITIDAIVQIYKILSLYILLLIFINPKMPVNNKTAPTKRSKNIPAPLNKLRMKTTNSPIPTKANNK